MNAKKPVTYWDYLKIDDLLALQTGTEEDSISPDELNFIVVHQVDELWFKLSIVELKEMIKILGATNVVESKIPLLVSKLDRLILLMKLCSTQFELMETMSPKAFMEFREKLGTASGFQSWQLRQLEFIIGLEEEQLVNLGSKTALQHLRNARSSLPGGEQMWQKIQEVLDGDTLKDVFHNWLYRTPIQGSTPNDPDDRLVVQRYLDAYLQAVNKQLKTQAYGLIEAEVGSKEGIEAQFKQTAAQAKEFLMATDVAEDNREKMKRIRVAILFIESNSKLPLLAWPRTVLEKVSEYESAMVIFRHRHARMVERMIGRRIGTGGSSGVDYLDNTTKYRIFTNLWTVRTILLPNHALPPVENMDFYEFESNEN